MRHVLKLNIPTGVPLIYEYSRGELKGTGYLYKWEL